MYRTPAPGATKLMRYSTNGQPDNQIILRSIVANRSLYRDWFQKNKCPGLCVTVLLPPYLSPTLITPVSGASPQATVLAWHAAATGGMLAGLGHAHAGRLKAGEGMLLVCSKGSLQNKLAKLKIRIKDNFAKIQKIHFGKCLNLPTSKVTFAEWVIGTKLPSNSHEK